MAEVFDAAEGAEDKVLHHMEVYHVSSTMGGTVIMIFHEKN